MKRTASITIAGASAESAPGGLAARIELVGAQVPPYLPRISSAQASAIFCRATSLALGVAWVS
ncbi:MAG TPA: hypothetical protein VN259_14795, partial [Xanthomonadales bacterium]|nr:hypothetical protein [Xanthomonadales bacterium]